MSMFKIFDVSGSAVSAQSQRLNVVASNLANADTVAGPDGKAYKARHVVFQTELMGELGAAGVRVSSVGEDNTLGRRVHDPKHPGADAEGYVTYSNVNTRRGDGQHDFGLALLPEQPGGDERRQEPAAEDAADGQFMSPHGSPKGEFPLGATERSDLGGSMSTISALADQLNSAAGSTSATQNEAGSEDRFLKLLVAQMQNQDPMNPLDNAQVTSQMAQINTVSGIDKLNKTVAGLNGQLVQLQALQGVTLVGRDVTVAGDRLSVADGVGVGGFELTAAADSVKVEILNAAGRVADTLDLGAQASGSHSFEWAAGAVQDGDGYRFRVTANAGSASVLGSRLMRDHVDAVSSAGNALSFELRHSGPVSYDTVKAFN